MVGFVNDPSFKVKEEDNKGAFVESSEVNKSLDTLGLYIPELDDLSLSLADSFLDFDCVKDYIEENQEPFMVDVKQEELGLVGAEKFDSGVAEKSLEMGQDDIFKEPFVEDGFRKFDYVVVEKSLEMSQDGTFKEPYVEDGVGKFGSDVVVKSFEMGREDGRKGTDFEDGVGKFGSLIEEEMGKVSLEGGLDESVGFDVNGGNGISKGVGVIGNRGGRTVGPRVAVAPPRF